MNALAETLCSSTVPSMDAFDMNDDDGDDVRFHNACLDEIDRYRRIDEWIPSYHNILSITALDCKRRLAKAGIVAVTAADYLQYTRDGCLEDLRIKAFSSMMDLGFFRNSHILRWFLFILGTDPSPYLREYMFRLLGSTLGAIAIGENTSPDTAQASQQTGLIIEQESSTEARQADLARKQTVVGALAALKAELGENQILKDALWEAIESPVISLREMGELLEICSLLYTPETSIHLVLKHPRYWKCQRTSRVSSPISPHLPLSDNLFPTNNFACLPQGKLTFTKTSKFRTTPMRKPLLTAPAPAPKRQDSNSSTAAPPVRTLLKPPKKPGTQGHPPSSVVHVAAATAAAASSTTATQAEESTRPKLTLKLNLKGAGARAPGV